MSYTEIMKTKVLDSFRKLHEGVDKVRLTDIADHANIGDSAIGCGQFRFWQEEGIPVTGVSSFHTLPARALRTTEPVFIHGGGNFGGLYRNHSEHRYMLAERLPAETLLIQGPQSVHWASQADHDEFRRRMAPRKNLRIGVRDHESFDALKDDVEQVILSPDSVHMLGSIPAPEPTVKEIRLVRRDPEATGSISGGVDWPKDLPYDRITSWLSHRTAEIPALRSVIPTSPSIWSARVDRRMARGVAMLAQGETVVTDRLHAMLIALQLGRKVVVKDNSIGKLRKYYDTWLHDAGADVTWS
jgi:exopolysaccharide biosynthesis predicted pyruvyltransferase EpsI